MSNFSKIKTYLGRIRNADAVVLKETDEMIQFEIKTRWWTKAFTIHYRDSDSPSDSLTLERPNYHYYYLQFSQENYPVSSEQFCTLTEWKWYTDEDDVLNRIKELRTRYQK